MHDGSSTPFGTGGYSSGGYAWSTTKVSWVTTVKIGLGSSSYGALLTAASKTLYLPATGHRVYNTGQVGLQGTNGLYWSTSVYDSIDGYRVFFTSSAVTPSDRAYYANAYSVRCVR